MPNTDNILAIDYGSKNIGLAYSIQGIITPLPKISNDPKTLENLKLVISQYHIKKIYVGISEGEFAKQTQKFVGFLRSMIKLPIETVEEAVSTIEAQDIFQKNQKNRKKIKEQIDSLAAAVILRRVIS